MTHPRSYVYDVRYVEKLERKLFSNLKKNYVCVCFLDLFLEIVYSKANILFSIYAR